MPAQQTNKNKTTLLTTMVILNLFKTKTFESCGGKTEPRAKLIKNCFKPEICTKSWKSLLLNKKYVHHSKDFVIYFRSEQKSKHGRTQLKKFSYQH